MGPPRSQTRRACDRCHAQKIRCPRGNQHSKESCSRCSNAGVRCVYSPALLTGRPVTNPIILSTQMSNNSALPFSSTSWDSMDVPSPSNLAPPINYLDNGTWNPQVLSLENTFDPNLDLDQAFDPEILVDVNSAGVLGDGRVPTATSTASLPSTADDSSSTETLRLWPPPSADIIEVCIKQLSELSVRLYPVYRTSCLFANAQKANPGSLLSSTTFDTVTYFLQEKHASDTAASHGSRALFEIFQSSRNLLDVLHRVQATTSASSPDSQAY